MEKQKQVVRDFRKWRPGVRFVAGDLMASPEFKIIPEEMVAESLELAVKAQEIADSAIYRMLSSGGAKA